MQNILIVIGTVVVLLYVWKTLGYNDPDPPPDSLIHQSLLQSEPTNAHPPVSTVANQLQTQVQQDQYSLQLQQQDQKDLMAAQKHWVLISSENQPKKNP